MEVEEEVVVVVGLWYRWWLVDIHITVSSSIYHDEEALWSNRFINYRQKEVILEELSIAWYSDSDACIWYDA